MKLPHQSLWIILGYRVLIFWKETMMLKIASPMLNLVRPAIDSCRTKVVVRTGIFCREFWDTFFFFFQLSKIQTCFLSHLSRLFLLLFVAPHLICRSVFLVFFLHPYCSMAVMDFLCAQQTHKRLG